MMRRYDNKIMLMVLMVMMAGWFCGGMVGTSCYLTGSCFCVGVGFLLHMTTQKSVC